MKKKKMQKRSANTVQLSNNNKHDVKAIDNLKELAKALPACSNLTGAMRFLCEDEAPKVTERYLALKTA